MKITENTFMLYSMIPIYVGIYRCELVSDSLLHYYKQLVRYKRRNDIVITILLP